MCSWFQCVSYVTVINQFLSFFIFILLPMHVFFKAAKFYSHIASLTLKSSLGTTAQTIDRSHNLHLSPFNSTSTYGANLFLPATIFSSLFILNFLIWFILQHFFYVAFKLFNLLSPMRRVVSSANTSWLRGHIFYPRR